MAAPPKWLRASRKTLLRVVYRGPQPTETLVHHWTEVSSRWHRDYERGRPSYPRQVVGVPGLPTAATVLEVGAGTGKLTRLLVREFAHVLAVEPDCDMRRWFTAVCPQARLIGGSAEGIPLADASVDGIFSAEAFHWFAHERALAEFARVLRPHGALVLMWNRPAGPIEPAIPEVEQLLEPHWPKEIERPLDLDPSRFAYAQDWPRAFEQSMFEPLQESRFANPHVVDPDGLVAFFGSMGWIDTLPEEERTSLLDQVRSRLTAGAYRMPFETDVHRTRRISRST
jgi:SAM-dependent methyltransferase